MLACRSDTLQWGLGWMLTNRALQIDGLTDCQAAPQPANALSGVTDYLNGIGNNVGDAWSRAFNSNPGGSLSPSGGNFNLLEFFGIGGEKKKKRSNDFCAAPGYS